MPERTPLYELLSRNMASNPQGEATQKGPELGDILNTVQETLKVNSLTAALKATQQDATPPPDPMAGVRDLGLNVGSLTEAALGVANTYKDLALVEREGRKEKDDLAFQAMERAQEAKEQSMTLMMQMMQTQMQQQIETLKATIEASATRPPDPMQQMVQQMMLQMLQENFNKKAEPPPPAAPQPNPIAQVVDSIASLERLKEVLAPALGLNKATTPDPVSSAMSGGVDKDVLRILLEHEREKEKMATMREVEEKRIATTAEFKGVLQDLVPAIMETAKSFRGGSTSTTMTASAGTVPHKCGACGGVTILPTLSDPFTCTACGAVNRTSAPLPPQRGLVI